MSTKPPPPPHEIIKIPSAGEEGRKELYVECIQARIQVFCYEQGFPVDGEEDHYDGTAEHFLLRTIPDKHPIGTIRANRIGHDDDDTPRIKLSRLVVLSQFRKYGLGKDLVLAAQNWALNAIAGKAVEIVLHAQIYVIPFYERYGFIVEGEEFDEDGAPHKQMVKRVVDN